MGVMGALILLRHGETEWSASGRHTGRTEVPLTARGERQAAALGPALTRRDGSAVFTSPARRAVDTAALAGLDGAKQDPDLWEWDYGGYEGRTTKEIRARRPGWYLWRDGVIPGGAAHPGETVTQLVAHGHLLRILTARWLGLDAAGGRLFRLETGTIATLGEEHDHPVITGWNIPAGQ